jgi:hypothetical protein
VEKLAASVSAGHGIMLAPNHCRPSDGFVVAALGRAAGQNVHIMASWHIFMQGRIERLLLPRAGVFSVYREGLDREAVRCAVRIMTEARRPLVIFPEGVISRHNDRLNSLMEGTAMIARSAARNRAAASPPGRVVVHPVAIRYHFEGDLAATLEPMLRDIEARLSWQPSRGMAPVDRLARIGEALLARKEVEHLGAVQDGCLDERIRNLIDSLLSPAEDAWLKGRHEGDVISRVKSLRTALLPGLVTGDLTKAERDRRWKLLAQAYLAQQLALYPEGYLASDPTAERILETAERLEEDTTDRVRAVSPLRAVVTVGEAIDVPRERARGGEDPVMRALRKSLESLLGLQAPDGNPVANP